MVTSWPPYLLFPTSTPDGSLLLESQDWRPRTYVRPGASTGTAAEIAYSASAASRRWPGMTTIQCELSVPVWCTLAPRSTTPPSRRSTTRTKRSGSSCACGGFERSPFGSVIAPPTTRLWRCTCSTKRRSRAWYGVPCAASVRNVVAHDALRASWPTQRWKHVPVRWPRRRCISFCAATSFADVQMCAKRFTRASMSSECAVASSGSLSARRYVSATALTDGRSTGSAATSATRSPKR
mmetsp:Transcript_9572/g.29817  ORF Transcript_9572/g.29817 Transcript_9572/m.29817 type:complete len:238 (+) Transcript_9572:713-1426(+)